MSSFETVHVDQSHWSQIVVTGEDRIRFLQGMCTANIESLKVGESVRANFLTDKGRVVSVFDVVCRDDDLVLLCEPVLGDTTVAALSKYAIVDDVGFELTQGPLHRVWSTPASVWTAPAIFAEPPTASDPDLVEVRRVEAGYPSYGVDVSQSDFPFESGLGDFVDYKKGCFIGQEPVARVFSKGSPNRVLRALVAEGDERLPVGATVEHPDKKDVGTVTSSVLSPTFGPVALAYIFKIAWESGTSVSVSGRPCTVRDVPLE